MPLASLLTPSPFARLEADLGYKFRSKSLLRQALTHPSYRHELSLGQVVEPDNQRLEFLGDAALGLATAHELYTRHPGLSEGDLTRLRAHLTNTRTLAETARCLGLGGHLRVGKGEESSGGRDRESNLADALEAIVGAALLEGGLAAVARIVARVFGPLFDQAGAEARNPKGRLQEWAQQLHHLAPVYAITAEEGPAHAPRFRAAVTLKGETLGEGQGGSKRDAESAAAEDALSRLPETGADGVKPSGPGL